MYRIFRKQIHHRHTPSHLRLLRNLKDRFIHHLHQDFQLISSLHISSAELSTSLLITLEKKKQDPIHVRYLLLSFVTGVLTANILASDPKYDARLRSSLRTLVIFHLITDRFACTFLLTLPIGLQNEFAQTSSNDLSSYKKQKCG